MKRLWATLDQMGATGHTKVPAWVATITGMASVTTIQAPAIGGAIKQAQRTFQANTNTKANIVRIFSPGAWHSDEVSERKRTNVMNQTINELDCTDEENLTSELADEHLEAAADPTKPVLWTYPTTSCGGGNCPW